MGCGHCQDACLIGAVQIDESTGKPSICIHCGYCVKFCPHNVLKHGKVKESLSDAY
ncbi:MAG: 4Fe-4S dicluster domain-containing protein [Deltaproteobacteria bacterium]